MKPKATYGHEHLLSAMILALILTLVGMPGYKATAAADELDFPSGVACPDFPLHIKTTGSLPQVYKEFKDRDGNIIRTLNAGKGWDLLFTNVDTGATFFIKGNGSVSHYTFNPDGTTTYTGTGHNVMIFFPTDVPPGPSTIQVSGRVVSMIDQDGVWTLQEISGKQIDICAALSQ